MSLSEQFSTEDLHPIDIVETLAEHHEWDFDRVADDQIAMAVEGQWRMYSITLAWSPQDETLRLDARTKAMKDDGDRSFALQCLLEGEATFVMIKVALKDIPGADEKAEEELAPLLGNRYIGPTPVDLRDNVALDYYIERELFFEMVSRRPITQP